MHDGDVIATWWRYGGHHDGDVDRLQPNVILFENKFRCLIGFESECGCAVRLFSEEFWITNLETQPHFSELEKNKNYFDKLPWQKHLSTLNNIFHSENSAFFGFITELSLASKKYRKNSRGRYRRNSTEKYWAWKQPFYFGYLWHWRRAHKRHRDLMSN